MTYIRTDFTMHGHGQVNDVHLVSGVHHRHEVHHMSGSIIGMVSTM